MTETRPLTKREERRFSKQAARRYWHAIAPDRSCNGVRSGICLRCLWWTLTGKHRAARRELLARFKRIEDCPHTNRRPNPHPVRSDERIAKAEICDDCGTGLVQWKRAS